MSALAIALVTLFIALLCRAQTTTSEPLTPVPAVWNVSGTLPSGVYGGAQPRFIYVMGGTDMSGRGNPVLTAIGPKSQVSNATFYIVNGTLSAKGCKFVDCVFKPARRGRLFLDGCALVSCELKVPTAEEATWTNPNDKVIVALRNSVIAQPKPRGGGVKGWDFLLWDDASKVSLQWENCTFMGLTRVTTSSIDKKRLPFLSAARTGGSFIRNCLFKKLQLGEHAFLLSENCAFNDCELVPLAADPEGPYRVSAMVVPENAVTGLKTWWPELTVNPVDASKAGAPFVADIQNQELVAAVNTVAAPVTTLEKMLPRPLPGTLVPTTATLPDTATRYRGILSQLPYEERRRLGRSITGTEGAPEIELKVESAAVRTMLTAALARGFGSETSLMTASVKRFPGIGLAMVDIEGQQEEKMKKALEEVGKFVQLRHQGWPRNATITLSCEGGYLSEDGPSAAVASALVLHSLITGEKFDPAFAVIGDMNADGSVQPVSGAAAKVRGAAHGACRVFAIPAKDEQSLSDLLFTDGPIPFAGIQVYAVGNFDEALALASQPRAPAIQSAIDEMTKVQDVLKRDSTQMANTLRHPQVIASLQKVIQAAPNHLSAKYLLMQATGKAPQSLSLAGSIRSVENAAFELVSSIKAKVENRQVDVFRPDAVATSIKRLQDLRVRCDLRVKNYTDAVIHFGTVVKHALEAGPVSSARSDELIRTIHGAAEAAGAEYSRLLNDPKLREEMSQ
jgi:hypothetical protein